MNNNHGDKCPDCASSLVAGEHEQPICLNIHCDWGKYDEEEGQTA